MTESYREKKTDGLRVLFCLGVTQNFFDSEAETRELVINATKSAFRDLRGRFGIKVLGTIDDDELMVGTSLNWPWTAYILADAPDLETITSVCNLIRVTEVGVDRLWKYMRIEARVGRELFFGNA